MKKTINELKTEVREEDKATAKKAFEAFCKDKIRHSLRAVRECEDKLSEVTEVLNTMTEDTLRKDYIEIDYSRDYKTPKDLYEREFGLKK